MEKILTIALQNAKPDMHNLMKVINATGNPQVAAEMLLGVYEYPVVPTQPGKVIQNQYHNPLKESYNPFTDEVTFKCYYTKTKTGWVAKSIEEPTVEDIVSDTYYRTDAALELNMDVEEFESLYERKSIVTSINDYESTTTTSLSRWLADQ